MISPRRALLERIERERTVAHAMPELPVRWRTRMAIAVEGGLVCEDPSELSDRALHAVAATARARLAIALAGGDEALVETHARTLIRAWAALADRERYVDELARATGSATDARRAVASLGLERVSHALSDRARDGGDLGGLLRALDEVPSDLAAAAERIRRDAIDRAADPVREALDALAARRPSVDEVCAAFDAVASAWRRCDRAVDLEVLAVERLGDFAWDLYRERALTDLARVLRTVAEPSASLAARIRRGEPAVAWAAPCAQVLVFQAELAPRFDTQLALAERAFELCPTLRNARVVLGDFLLTRAERAIDRGAERTSDRTLPEDDVARATTLHPDLKRLPAVREKVEQRRRRAS